MSKENTEECVAYTVHIPATPDRRDMSESQTSPFEDSKKSGHLMGGFYIKDTIYTGGFNSVTRAHVIENLVDEPKGVKSELVCGMKGCDEKA
ncbi:Cellulose synthase-like protein D5 [Camellia lanceoleosa]|uniref:Cellulose synthase-like protein D5 n=1 Tax=Camellia lanceoleosa TaxID=1840588 RepID=A0ACC0FJH7_9ERIC|nr:Cellulose synthase-like protein D5 [Camellia lanceoleosa]